MELRWGGIRGSMRAESYRAAPPLTSRDRARPRLGSGADLSMPSSLVRHAQLRVGAMTPVIALVRSNTRRPRGASHAQCDHWGSARCRQCLMMHDASAAELSALSYEPMHCGQTRA